MMQQWNSIPVDSSYPFNARYQFGWHTLVLAISVG